jgi:uncharacterized membrane-anchored protein
MERMENRINGDDSNVNIEKVKNSKNFLILADGKNDFFKDSDFKILFPDKILIALDGAGEILRKTSIVPDIILGDMDTVSQETLEFLQDLLSKSCGNRIKICWS